MATKGYNLEQTGEQVQAALNRIINLSTATEETDGLMSSSDKSSLENLNTEINNKVDKVSGKGLSTNDFTNEEKAKVDSAYQAPSSGIPKADLSSEVQASLTNADNAVQGLSEVNAKIPAQATSQNQLADKAFVNSSVATASADFKGTYDTLQELQAVTADKNDYGYVVSTDSAGNTIYSRYKYTGSAWVFEYDLNNSSFTASEWAAIQSGITSAGVQKLNALPTNSELNTALAGKQATLVSGTNIKTVGGQSLVGSGNVPMNDPDAVKYTAQTPTDAQKTQARTNIGAYAKPSGGIPKTDLSSGVQGSLDLADSAIQARPSGEVDPTITPAEYATQEELAQLEAKVTDLDVEINGIVPVSGSTNTSNLNNTATPYGTLYVLDGLRIIPGKLYTLKITFGTEVSVNQLTTRLYQGHNTTPNVTLDNITTTTMLSSRTITFKALDSYADYSTIGFYLVLTNQTYLGVSIDVTLTSEYIGINERVILESAITMDNFPCKSGYYDGLGQYYNDSAYVNFTIRKFQLPIQIYGKTNNSAVPYCVEFDANGDVTAYHSPGIGEADFVIPSVNPNTDFVIISLYKNDPSHPISIYCGRDIALNANTDAKISELATTIGGYVPVVKLFDYSSLTDTQKIIVSSVKELYIVAHGSFVPTKLVELQRNVGGYWIIGLSDGNETKYCTVSAETEFFKASNISGNFDVYARIDWRFLPSSGGYGSLDLTLANTAFELGANPYIETYYYNRTFSYDNSILTVVKGTIGDPSFLGSDYISLVGAKKITIGSYMYAVSPNYPCIVFYDKNKTQISKYSPSVGTFEENTYDVPENAWYFRANCYKNQTGSFFAKLEFALPGPVDYLAKYKADLDAVVENRIKVTELNFSTADGSLRSFLESLSNSSYYNRYIVNLAPGVYDLSSEFTAEEIADASFWGVWVYDYITLRGAGANETEITLTLATANSHISTINLKGTATIESLTISGTRTRYAVHDDRETADTHTVERLIRNCKMVAQECYYSAAFGCGVRSGEVMRIENCEFTSDTIPFLWHTGLSQAKAADLTVQNCKFVAGGTSNSIMIRSVGSGVVNGVHLIGNDISKAIFQEDGNYPGVGIDFKVDGFGNRSGMDVTVKTQSATDWTPDFRDVDIVPTYIIG